MTAPHDPHLRIGDAERDRAAAELGEHYAQGRLTREEHHERLDGIWSARTYADLGPLFADLPGWPTPTVRMSTASVPSAPRRRRHLPGALLVVLAVLLGVVVLAHLPLLLFLLLGWFVLTRHGGCGRARRRPHWS